MFNVKKYMRQYYEVKYNHWIKKVIELLQRDEALKVENIELKKYRQMIEKMKNNKYGAWVSLPESFTNLTDFIYDIEKEVTE